MLRIRCILESGNPTSPAGSAGTSAIQAVSAATTTVNTIGKGLSFASLIITTVNTTLNVINNGITTRSIGQQTLVHGPNVGNPEPDPNSNPFFNYPIFEAENSYPDIKRIDLLYWKIAPPSQKIIIGKFKYLVFRYEADVNKQRANGRLAEDANPQCANQRGFVQHCHEVPYKSTMEGGAGAIMMPASIKENAGHGASLMWFYKNLSPGDIFLIPVGEEVKEPVPVPVPVPVPALNPKKQTTPQQKKLRKAEPIDLSPLLIPVIITVIEQYWWVIFAL